MYMMLLTWFYYEISIVSVRIRLLNKVFFLQYRMMRDVSRRPNFPEVKTALKSFASHCCYIKIAVLQNITTRSGFLVP